MISFSMNKKTQSIRIYWSYHLCSESDIRCFDAVNALYVYTSCLLSPDVKQPSLPPLQKEGRKKVIFQNASALQKGHRTKDRLNFKHVVLNTPGSPCEGKKQAAVDAPHKQYHKAQPNQCQGNLELRLLRRSQVQCHS